MTVPDSVRMELKAFLYIWRLLVCWFLLVPVCKLNENIRGEFISHIFTVNQMGGTDTADGPGSHFFQFAGFGYLVWGWS